MNEMQNTIDDMTIENDSMNIELSKKDNLIAKQAQELTLMSEIKSQRDQLQQEVIDQQE